MRKETFIKRINEIINDAVLLENLEAMDMSPGAKENVAVRMRENVNKLIKSYRGE